MPLPKVTATSSQGQSPEVWTWKGTASTPSAFPFLAITTQLYLKIVLLIHSRKIVLFLLLLEMVVRGGEKT